MAGYGQERQALSKTILVDLDCPVYPFIEHMAIMLVAHRFTPYDSMQLMDMYKTWNVWEDWGIPKGEFDMLWTKWVEDGTFYSGRVTDSKWLEPVPGARDALWELSDHDWKIHILTSRLNHPGHYEKTITSTMGWLQKTGIPFHGITFVEEDKSFIEADVIVDDKPEHLYESLCPERYLYPAKHNTNARNEGEFAVLDRTNPWPDLVATLCYDEDVNE